MLAAIKNGASFIPGLILLIDSTTAVVSSAGFSRPWPKPPFVEVGSHVNAGDVVCIVEAIFVVIFA